MRQQRGAICLVKVLAVLNLRTPLLGLATIYASPLSTQPASPRVMHRVPATVRLIPMLHFAQSFQSQYQIVGLRLRGGEEGSCRRDDADVDVVVDDGVVNPRLICIRISSLTAWLCTSGWWHAFVLRNRPALKPQRRSKSLFRMARFKQLPILSLVNSASRHVRTS